MVAMDFQAAEQRQFRLLRYALLSLVALAALSLIAALLIVEGYQERLATAEHAVVELRGELSVSVLGDIDFEQLVEHATTARGVVAYLGAPLPDVLESVTSALPPNVRLELLEYDAREGAGTVRAVSPDPHALAEFVRGLEVGPSVRRAVVARQETVPGPEVSHRQDIHLIAEP